MGWRKTGEMHPPRPIQVHTCDQCGADIGTPDGHGSKYPYFEIMAKRYQPVSVDDSSMDSYSTCSPKCLLALAKRVAAGERIEVSEPD